MAKWRLAQSGEKDGAQARSSNAKTKKRERRPGELSTFQKVVIVLFIAVFALSTLAGALASVFQSSQTVEYNVDYVDSQYTSSPSSRRIPRTPRRCSRPPGPARRGARRS